VAGRVRKLNPGFSFGLGNRVTGKAIGPARPRGVVWAGKAGRGKEGKGKGVGYLEASHDEIHSNLFPLPLWYLQGLQQSGRSLMVGLNSMVGVA
jgi:hypothetical protein